MSMNRLAVLLPITSKGKESDHESDAGWIKRIAIDLSFGHEPAIEIFIIIGVDETDLIMYRHLPELKDSLRELYPRIRIVEETFLESDLERLPKGPICWMWSQLACVAVKLKADAFVLLGDDTVLSPPSWPAMVLKRFNSDPSLLCLLLNDRTDPGYPSFPVIKSTLLFHGDKHGDKLLPDIFVNQGGDPFLAELCRRLGGLGVCQEISVHNKVGGIQLPDDAHYVPPRYPRAYPPPGQVLEALRQWTERAQRNGVGRRSLTVDVLVPSYRANTVVLEGILAACDLPHGSGVDVRFGIVIDDPNCPELVRSQLLCLQKKWLGRLRLRFNAVNLGASGTRNKCLEECQAECVIFLDDDVAPTPGLVRAYAAAFEKHPVERGFAGPTLLPRPPTLAACGLHLSDVSFFWDAPLTMSRVPWSVTANVAFRNTTERFDLRFPKTGGGEDIDFCLRASPGGLLSVPEAIAHHPLWNNGKPCFLRFAAWSYGDGGLIGIYGRQFGYRAAANAVEMMLLVLLIQLVALPLSLAPVPVLICTPSLWSHVSIFVAEVCMDLVTNFGPERRAKHPTPSIAMLIMASIYSTLLRFISEAGRIWGHFSRGEPHLLFSRFDWFCGMIPSIKRDEIIKSFWRMAGYLLAIAVCHALAV